MRAHKFIRTEDQLYFAAIGSGKILGLTADGKPVEIPTELSKRDASGTKASGAIGSLGNVLD